MFAKVALMCLMGMAWARPDKLPSPAQSGYGYEPPSQPLSYSPPTPSYTPPQNSYEPPQQSYSAPTQSYQAPQQSYSAPAPSYEQEHEPAMPFDFGYAVKDDYKGLDFGHNAVSDGDVVTGEYRVLLPDGRTQIVTYRADWKNGYQAEVRYEGEAQYPEPQAYQPAPSYSAPAQSYSAPTQSYSAPTQSYSAPSQSYEEPDSLYGAPNH